MKRVKLLYLAVVALLAGAAFTACNNGDYKAGPAATGQQVYFDEGNSTTLSIGDEVTSLSIALHRVADAEPLSVAILSEVSEGAESLFTIPASVDFAAGETDKDLVIAIDRANLVDGEEYKIDLAVADDTLTTPYGYNQWSLSITPWPWAEFEANDSKGMFREDWLTALWKVDNLEYEVTIYKHKTKENVFLLVEPWNWSYLTEAFGRSKEQIEGEGMVTYTPTNIQIDCSDPNKVIIPKQLSGVTDLDPSYGDYYIETVEPGTLKDGVIEFPTKGLGLSCLAGGAYANKNGLFRIVLPGYEAVDYSLAVAYGGMKVAADNVTVSAVLDFTCGADVTGVNYLLLADDVTADAATIIASIADGSAENIQEIADFEAGTTNVSIEAELASGVYTVVAVAKDKAGQPVVATAVAESFYFPGFGGEAKDVEASAALYYVSEVLSQYAEQFPDYSSLAYQIKGSELKSLKRYVNTTDLIDNVEDYGLTLEQVMAQYASAVSDEVIASINAGGYANILINLKANTSYTMVIEATNIYGKTEIIKSKPLATKALPYAGELKVGDYAMTYVADGSTTFENLFTVNPTDGSETEFIVDDFGFEDGTSWYATYDSAAGTLTLSGLQVGYEDEGNMFGQFFYYDTNKTMVYGVCSFASEESEGDDPCVITVSAEKALAGLTTTVAVPVLGASDGSLKGYLGYYPAAGTTIAQAAATSAKAKKATVKRVNVPFSSVKASAVPMRYSKRWANKVTDVLAVPASTGVHGLAVKTAVCEPLPKAKPMRNKVAFSSLNAWK